MSSKKGLLGRFRKEFREAEHAFTDLVKKRKLKEKAMVAINTARAKEGMREWAKEWKRKPPRWTSVYYWDDPVPLKLMQGYYRKLGFATRVRRGRGKAKNYFFDIYGWNSWCVETGLPKPVPKKGQIKKLKRVC
ncbi:MAG: hypothetical protein PVI03_01265 [Candidatus Thorarchaeota archaeon]|jgi:hypothetical protein